MRLCMSTCMSTSFLFHIHNVYMCQLLFNYHVQTTYNMNIPITICVCVPVDEGFASCLHTCDLIFKGLYFNIHTFLSFLWIHTYHVHNKNVHFCMHLPFPCVRLSKKKKKTSSLSGSIPSVCIPTTWTRAHVCMCTPRLSNPNKPNTCKQVNAKQTTYLCLHTYAYKMFIKQLKW